MIYEVHQWVASVAGECKPPCLEVGSRRVQGDFVDLRPLFEGPYVGLDMQEGPGVDVVSDFEQEGWYRAGPDRFNTVICTETLEHMRDPKRAVERMYDALNPGGVCVITVPFAWYPHDYPRDYWRISPDGLQDILDGAGFSDVQTGFGGAPLTIAWHPAFQEEAYQNTVWSHALAVARKAA